MPASPRLQALLRAKEENEIGNFLSAVLEAQDEIGGIEAERYMEIMDRSPYSTGVPVRVGYEDDDQISPLDVAAIVSSSIPIVGDITGLAADADMYARDPESRNMINYLLSAAGAIPLVPAASQIRKVLKTDDTSEPDLQFLHNTSAGKLKRQEAMGGMPMPSIAVTRQDIPFESFGDITLVGKPESFDPTASRSNVVYDADAYTIRAPSPVKQANKDAYKKLNEEFGAIARKYDGYLDDVKYELADLETKKGINESGYNRIVRFFENDRVTDIAFLNDQGITNIPMSKKYDGVDGSEIDKMIEPMRDQRQAWADNKLDEYFSGEELFIANPNRDYLTTSPKLKPYTSDEVTKYMKKRKGAGQESTMTVGVGKVRANLAKQLKSLPQIKSEKGRLLTADDVAEFKTEMDSTLIDIQDLMEPFYKYASGGFAYRDEVGEMIYESDRIGLDRALQKFGFENVSEEMKNMIRRYQSDLRSGPTEYFEAKPGRSVNMAEFSGAIVPDDAPQSTINTLEKAGLKVVKYEDSEGRLEARKAFPGTAFSIAGGIVLFKTLQEEEQQEDA